jgi:hypothetical protein
VVVDRSSLLGVALGLWPGRQRPGRSRVEDRFRVGGEAVEVVMGLVQGRMRGHVCEVLRDMEARAGKIMGARGGDEQLFVTILGASSLLTTDTKYTRQK